jgi:biopolymer transport protein ExbD
MASTPFHPEQELRAELNVTPFVDVMLVLLVIFMVVAPQLTRETPVDLPAAKHARATDAGDRLILAVGADGALTLDGLAVAREELPARVREMLAGRSDGALLLEADRAVAHGVVVEVLDECRSGGVTAIGIVTRPHG